ncbi:endolytic transglycosylase MltG [Streptococcus sp. NLN76]|uniref:endolytic transglycosylase MltG n=1 Tax=Streptococcus sp. NLN76 TaxID=2822800 RepID=UPI001FFD3490|nr:endolytic transglycosylase MltG [Streptococcus sp. NLN76]
MADQDDRRRGLSFKEQILRDLSQSKKKRQEVMLAAQQAKMETIANEQARELEAVKLTGAESEPQDLGHKQPTKVPLQAVRGTQGEAKTNKPQETKRRGKSVQIPLSIGKKHTKTIETEALRKQRSVPAAKEKAHAEAIQQKQPGSHIRMKAAPGKSLSFAAEENKQSLAPVKEAKLARVEAVAWQGEDDDMEKRLEKRRKQNQVAKKIVGIVTLILLVCLIATGIFGYTYVQSALGPIDKDSTEYVQVEIPIGSSNREIGRILEDAGLIESGQVFNFYTQFRNHTDFQSGYYNLQKNMDVEEIIERLKEGGTESPVAPSLGKITIPEGYTLEQIADVVTLNAASKDGKEKSIFSKEEFMAKVQDDAFIEAEKAKYPTLLSSLPSKESGVKYRLEGYLFPATYDYNEGDTVENLIDQMIAAMDANLAQFYGTISEQQKSVNDILTLASLVEKEGATDEDRKNIASAFNNRLSQQMPLQSNIAILYAMGKLGQKTTLAEDAGIDTNIDSPFNIYKNQGLMPGPVDSPGMAAIRATIEPNKTDYLYFVADVDTGTVYYANNIEEHNQNVEEHVNSKLANQSASSN